MLLPFPYLLFYHCFQPPLTSHLDHCWKLLACFFASRLFSTPLQRQQVQIQSVTSLSEVLYSKPQHSQDKAWCPSPGTPAPLRSDLALPFQAYLLPFEAQTTISHGVFPFLDAWFHSSFEIGSQLHFVKAFPLCPSALSPAVPSALGLSPGPCVCLSLVTLITITVAVYLPLLINSKLLTDRDYTFTFSIPEIFRSGGLFRNTQGIIDWDTFNPKRFFFLIWQAFYFMEDTSWNSPF